MMGPGSRSGSVQIDFFNALTCNVSGECLELAWIQQYDDSITGASNISYFIKLKYHTIKTVRFNIEYEYNISMTINAVPIDVRLTGTKKWGWIRRGQCLRESLNCGNVK